MICHFARLPTPDAAGYGGQDFCILNFDLILVDTVFTITNAIRIFAVGTVSFFITLVLTPLWTKILFKYKLRKQIRAGVSPIYEEMHKHKEGTPTMGGVLIWGTVLLLALIFWWFSKLWPEGLIGKLNFVSRGQTFVPLGAMVISALVGMADDLFGIFKIGPHGGGLRVRNRIFLYLLVALGGAWWFFYKLEWNFINIPFLGDFTVGLWYIPIFIFVISAAAHSANITDGLDGLAGGVFLTMFAAFGAIAFIQGRMDLVVFTSAIIGALIAFLWFNIYPAKFFMGDTGSMALGVTIGIIAMLTNTVLLLPIIGLIFVVESGSVILQVVSKKLRGKKLFFSTPIHHHFEAKGWPETQVTMRFWMISAIAAIIGLIIFLIDSKIPPLF